MPKKKRVTCPHCGYFNHYEYVEPCRCSYCMAVMEGVKDAKE